MTAKSSLYKKTPTTPQKALELITRMLHRIHQKVLSFISFREKNELGPWVSSGQWAQKAGLTQQVYALSATSSLDGLKLEG